MWDKASDITVTRQWLRHIVTTIVVGLCLATSGCGGLNARSATLAEIQALKARAAAPPHLQTGDKIRIAVFGEDALTGAYKIDPSGYIAFPLVGTVRAAGLTQHQLAQELATDLKRKFLKNPQVTVDITEFRPFYILGEVAKPGDYPYTSGLDVLSAIAMAGGRTYRAKSSIVLIKHAGDSEMKEYTLSSPIPILPGDIIEVPRRYF